MHYEIGICRQLMANVVKIGEIRPFEDRKFAIQTSIVFSLLQAFRTSLKIQ